MEDTKPSEVVDDLSRSGVAGSIARFVLRRTLGNGTFGQVFEAEDSVTGDRVALKQLRTSDPTAIYRFKKEFRSLADVSHPNLIRFHELFAVGDDWWLTMDLVDGQDFLDYIEEDPRRLRPAFPQLIAGVDAIHARDKLHRDLKPENVLVTR